MGSWVVSGKGVRWWVLVCGSEFLNGRAGADEVAVAVDVVDTADWGPVFVGLDPRERVGGLFASVGVWPRIAE